MTPAISSLSGTYRFSNKQEPCTISYLRTAGFPEDRRPLGISEVHNYIVAPDSWNLKPVFEKTKLAFSRVVMNGETHVSIFDQVLKIPASTIQGVVKDVKSQFGKEVTRLALLFLITDEPYDEKTHLAKIPVRCLQEMTLTPRELDQEFYSLKMQAGDYDELEENYQKRELHRRLSSSFSRGIDPRVVARFLRKRAASKANVAAADSTLSSWMPASDLKSLDELTERINSSNSLSVSAPPDAYLPTLNEALEEDGSFTKPNRRQYF